MAAHKLFTGCVRHIIDIKMTCLTLNIGMKQDLHQHITQLFAKVIVIVCIQRLTCLVDFLDEIPPNALMRLCLIPGAAAFGAQERNQSYKVFQAVLIQALKI